jgi:hypothetical protein
VSKTQKLLRTFSSCPDIKILVFMHSGPEQAVILFFTAAVNTPNSANISRAKLQLQNRVYSGIIARYMHELVARISFSTGTIK